MTHANAHRRLGLPVLAATLLAAGSCGSAQENPICKEAQSQVETCLGTDAVPPFDGCDAQAQKSAQGILDQLNESGCNGPPAGKDDSVLCGVLVWDPLGWCTDPPEPLGPEPQGNPTKYPIVLAHGFDTSTTNFWRFNDVDVALRDDGHQVMLGSVPPFDTPQVRAGFLADEVDQFLEQTGAEKVNLVCFSAGGLDCRYLVSDGGMGYGDRVASVTTLSTPHRGTYVADAAIGVLPPSDRSDAIDAIATMYGETFSDVADDSHLVAALTQLSEAHMPEFNDAVPDAAGVFYQSWGAVSNVAGVANPHTHAEDDACTDENGNDLFLHHEGTHDVMDGLLVGSAAFVAHGTELRPNDGVCAVESAKWGLFRGCVPGDHLDLVGQIDDVPPDRRTGFDYLRFYRNIAFDLAARGF